MDRAVFSNNILVLCNSMASLGGNGQHAPMARDTADGMLKYS